MKDKDSDDLFADLNPLAKIDDGLTPLGRPSHEVIQETIKKSGGTPFGAPLGNGLTTLTTKIVAYFKLKSFFGFETFERKTTRANRFSRYGASRFRGDYDLEKVKKHEKEKEQAAGKKRRWFSR